MNAKKRFPFDARVMVLLLVAISALWLTPSASAQSVLMAGSTNNVTVNPGDTIEAGFEVALGNNPHPADTVSVSNAVIRVSVNCPDGSSQTLNVNIPSQSVSVPANSNNWSSGGGVYQGRTTAPSNLCGGKQGRTTGATLMANFGDECHGGEGGGGESATKKGDHEGDKGCCEEEHCFRFHVRRHHNGDDSGDEVSDRHCEEERVRECETPEKREHRECCKDKEKD